MDSWVGSVDSSYSSIILVKRLIHKEKGLVLLTLNGKQLSSSKSEFLKNHSFKNVWLGKRQNCGKSSGECDATVNCIVCDTVPFP